MKDPTIDRIRQVRHEISEEFDHDAKKLVAHYIEYQEQFADQLLREPQNHKLHGIESLLVEDLVSEKEEE